MTNNLTNTVVAHRKRLGLSQSELAALIGHTQSSIHRLETGEKAPSLKTLLALSELFSLSADRIYPDLARDVRAKLYRSFSDYLTRYQCLPETTISAHHLRAYQRLLGELKRSSL